MKTAPQALAICLLSTVLLIGCATTNGTNQSANSERRDIQAMANDETIALAISKAIYTDESLRHNVHINAYSYNGVVVLTGEAPDETLRNKSIEHARHITNIKRIHNEVRIGPKADLKSRSYDRWLSAKVKAKLIAEKRIKAINIRVITESNSIYLMGLVSRQEGQIASDIARRVDGAKEVVTLFEYTN